MEIEIHELHASSFRNLSEDEITSITGGIGNFAFGAATYGIGAALTGNFSWGGLAGATAAGAITNGFSALAGGGRLATAYFGGVGAGSGGALSEATDRYIELVRDPIN